VLNLIIDFHVHCFPDALAKRALKTLSEVGNVIPRTNGMVSGIKTSMQTAQIDASVVLGISTKPTQTETLNNWIASIQDDKIIGFGSVHQKNEDIKVELRRCKEMGIKGIKLHPDYQGFFVDDKEMLKIYEQIFDLDLILMFHAGVDIGLPPPTHCTPERLAKVLDVFEGAKIVAAHMGGHDCWDDVQRHLVGRQVYLDTSFSVGRLKDEEFKSMVNAHGYDKILFGTDSPWDSQDIEVEKIKKMQFPIEIQNAILGDNAEKLLKLS
jgi:uncharacterized protein